MQLRHLLTLPVSNIYKRLSWPLPVPSACWSVVFSILRNLLRLILFICCNQFILYSCILSKTGVIFSSFANLVQVYPAVFDIHFISAAVILLGSLAGMFQLSLPYRATVLYHFVVFCGPNILFIMPVVFKLFNLLSMSTSLSYNINFLSS